MLKHALGIAACAAGLATAATAMAAAPADPLRPAQALLAQGRHAEAYAAYTRQAKRPLAQFMLGMFHENGWGRPVDHVAACHWFERSARGGVPLAEHLAGDCVSRRARGSPQEQAALDWYLRAGRHGHLISWCAAGELLIRGRGVPQDVPQGLALCERAAQGGSSAAMLRLARLLLEDADVPHDPAAARRWYAAAAERHVPEAQYRLGLMLAQGEGGEPDLNTALFWLETAASEGHAPAYLPTALLYLHAPRPADTGVPTPEHLAKAYLWTRAAVQAHGDPAQATTASQLQAEILAVMPDSWRADLDGRVAEHLARHARQP